MRRQPFQPFKVRLADGSALPVNHPEFVAVGQRLAVVVAEDDSWSVIEPLLIVSIDYDAPGSSEKRGKRNGRK